MFYPHSSRVLSLQSIFYGINAEKPEQSYGDRQKAPSVNCAPTPVLEDFLPVLGTFFICIQYHCTSEMRDWQCAIGHSRHLVWIVRMQAGRHETML